MIWFVAVAGGLAIVFLVDRIKDVESRLAELKEQVQTLREDLRRRTEEQRPDEEQPRAPAPIESQRIKVIRPARPLPAPTPREHVGGDLPKPAPPPLPSTPSRQERQAPTRKEQPPEEAPPPRWKPLEDLVREKLKALGPSDPDMGWEMALGTYWLPRIGIAALAVSVVFLMTLALQQWGPPVRIALGYAICAALLGLAWRVEKKHPPYARVLYSGGFALTYFVTFATHFVPFARVFESPYPALAALGVVVGIWAAVAQRRKSPVIAFLVTALGHFTIGLATFSIDDPARVSIAAILVLSAGSAFFLLWNRWYYVASTGLAASYVNHFLIMARSDAPDAWGIFVLSLTVLSSYFLIYALAELFAGEDLRRKSVPMWFRSGFVTFNSAAYFVLGSLVMAGFSFSEDYQYLFRYALALALLLLSFAYLRWRAGDPVHNAYQTKAIVAVTLGLANQFSAAALTAWLAVEMVALLYSARRSGLVVTRLLAIAVALVAFLHGTASALTMPALTYGGEAYGETLATVLVTLLGFLGASWLYQRTDWTLRSPQAAFLGARFHGILWRADILARPPETDSGESKPFNGLLYPHLYAWAFVILFALFTPLLFPTADRALITAGVAVALAVAAVGTNSPPFGYGTAALVLLGTFWAVVQAVRTETLEYQAAEYGLTLLKVSVAFLALLFITEYSRRVVRRSPEREAPLFPRGGFLHVATPLRDSVYVSRWRDRQCEPVWPFFLAAAAAVTGIGYAAMLSEWGHGMIPLAAIAVTLTAAAAMLNALPLGLAGWLFVAAGAGTATWELVDGAKPGIVIPALILFGFAALTSESRYVPVRRGLALHQAIPAPYVLYGIVTLLTGLFLTVDHPSGSAISALTISAAAASLLVYALHRHALALSALAFYLWAHGIWHQAAWADNAAPVWTVTLILLVFGVAADRYFTLQAIRMVCPIFLIAAWGTCLRFFGLAISADWWPFAAAALSAGLLIYGLALRSPTAAVLSLAGTLLASGVGIRHTFTETVPNGPLIAGYLGAAVLWMVYERLTSRAAARFGLTLPFQPAGLLIAVAAGLLVLMLSRIPELSEFYLTISWTVLAVVLFAVSLAFGEKRYRYAGLAVLLLASLRVVIVDTRELETLPKVFSWAVLGFVLLALGYGYVKAFARTQPASDPASEVDPETSSGPTN